MPRILVVEDNEMNRDMLARRLERKGYEVVVAPNGEEAWQRPGADPPALDPDGHEPACGGRLGGHSPHPKSTRRPRQSR